jgi:hypothetical protein
MKVDLLPMHTDIGDDASGRHEVLAENEGRGRAYSFDGASSRSSRTKKIMRRRRLDLI